MRLRWLHTVLFLTLFVPTASADTLTIPTDITVFGKTDVFSGPSFVVSGAFGATDWFALTADGTVDLASGRFTANAAGVIVAPGFNEHWQFPWANCHGSGERCSARVSLRVSTHRQWRPRLLPGLHADATSGLGQCDAANDAHGDAHAGVDVSWLHRLRRRRDAALPGQRHQHERQ